MLEGHHSFLAAYLAPLEAVLGDPGVVEIAINPDGRVWIERQGTEHMTLLPDTMFSPTAAGDLAHAVAGEAGSQISERRPLVSGKITHAGAPIRAQVVQKPVVEGCASITLRRYSESRLSLGEIALLRGELVDLAEERRSLARDVMRLAAENRIAEAMTLCVRERLNVMVSGGTSSGKTTFARALLAMVDAGERIVTIEDAYELFPPQENRVMLKAERRSEGERTAARLLEASLRMRPDRIILGELRGEECKTFLDAINTGHSGSFTTIHADTARKAIDRLALMVMSVGINMTFAEVQRYCASSIDVIVQLGRSGGRRGVVEVFLPAP